MGHEAQGNRDDTGTFECLAFRRIPYLSGRPDRAVPIGADDIVDLQIALNTCPTLEEFLGEV
jgi:hypothetical protein